MKVIPNYQSGMSTADYMTAAVTAATDAITDAKARAAAGDAEATRLLADVAARYTRVAARLLQLGEVVTARNGLAAAKATLDALDSTVSDYTDRLKLVQAEEEGLVTLDPGFYDTAATTEALQAASTTFTTLAAACS